MAEEQQAQAQTQAQTPPPAGAQSTGHESVPYARFAEVISERNDLRQRIEALEAARKADEDKRLADQQEWQKLAEQRAARISELEPVAKRVQEIAEALQATVKARVERLPEDMRGLVPEYEDPRKTLAWLDANEARLLRPVAPGTDAGTRGEAGQSVPRLSDWELQLARIAGLTPEQWAKYRAQGQVLEARDDIPRT